MKTIGEVLKSARQSKKISIKGLEKTTKIKATFIEAIEKEKWQLLPPFPTVVGFVKSLAKSLEVNESLAVAVLRRDYPPRSLRIEPKPDVASRFSWSPKLTFILGIAGILVVVFGYLAFQYVRFISPPKLDVQSPKENQVISGGSVVVFGSTDSDAKITINNQPVLVNDDGGFSINFQISKETKEIDIISVNRSGKMTEIKRDIKIE